LQTLVPDEEDTGVIGSVGRCVRPQRRGRFEQSQLEPWPAHRYWL
jgi:hypothetical protein